MDKVNVSAIIDDPDVITLTWLVLGRVTMPNQVQDPGVEEG